MGGWAYCLGSDSIMQFTSFFLKHHGLPTVFQPASKKRGGERAVGKHGEEGEANHGGNGGPGGRVKGDGRGR